MNASPNKRLAYELIVIGGSLGGANALKATLAPLPSEFPLAIAIVLHRGKHSGVELVDSLQKSCALPVDDVEDKHPIVPGRVYVAPPDYHLLVEPGHFCLSTEGPVDMARPAINVLFETASDAYGRKVVGALLTGNSEDGVRGLALIRQRGGFTVVQRPETAEARIMPEAALRDIPVDKVLGPSEIGFLFTELTSGYLKPEATNGRNRKKTRNTHSR